MISISSGVALENYVNCTKKNWQNTTTHAAREDNGNEDINNIIKGRSCNNEFDGK